MIMYGVNVMRNIITADTDPMLADVNNVEIRKLKDLIMKIKKKKVFTMSVPERYNTNAKQHQKT